METKRIFARGVVAALAAGITLVPVAATPSHADVDDYKCTVVGRATRGCVAFYNDGNPSSTQSRIRVMYNNADRSKFDACKWTDDSWCKIQYVAARNYSVQAWDADAFAVPVNCKAEIRPSNSPTWQDANTSSLSTYLSPAYYGWKWYKVSGYPTTLRTYAVRVKTCW